MTLLFIIFLLVNIQIMNTEREMYLLSITPEKKILQITSKTYMYCISEENVDAAVFTLPPLNKLDDSTSLMNKRFWKNDDWVIKRSSDSTRTAVLDRRWEDFNITRTNYLRFDKSTTSVSFSVYGTNAIEFFADDGETLDYFRQPVNNTETWNTFTIFQKDGYVHYFGNSERNFRTYWLRPWQFVVRTQAEAYFKIHDYEYREATVHNNEENSTTLIIPSSKISLLIVYVYLCKSCVLEVSHNGEKILNMSSNVKKHDASLEKWQSYKIMINSSVSNEITFVRRQKESTEEGYWRLDVRDRNYMYDAAVFKLESADEIPLCKYLQAPEEPPICEKENMVNPINVNCKVGFLGKTCSIKCEDVLGEKYNYCENHKIWYNNIYECPWGYSGDSCDKECENGEYGFSCKQNCPNNCPKSCDKKSGECTESDKSRNIQLNPVLTLVEHFILLVIIASVIIITTICCIRRKKNNIRIV
ncbi:uncharacterized protein LOC135138865 isoform X1 [Zophobas morio]|uniref:uncharacterized protein LOC135138865 isoform X1 n=1 Tax=Zophobas morio TaxID=2755281 RepID=UPI003083577F